MNSPKIKIKFSPTSAADVRSIVGEVNCKLSLVILSPPGSPAASSSHKNVRPSSVGLDTSPVCSLYVPVKTQSELGQFAD